MTDAPISAQRANVERVKDKLARAAHVLPAVTKYIEDQADAIIEKGTDVMNHADKAAAPHLSMLKDADTGLSELDDALAPLGNGGPLQSSNGSATPSTSPTASPAPAAQPAIQPAAAAPVSASS